MPYFDAHNHLQDSRLNSVRNEYIKDLQDSSIEECVVNGTGTEDWWSVEELSKHQGIRPAFGLHPWKVSSQPENWFELLQHFIQRHPGCLIGEIGLDKWIRNPDFDVQIPAFEQQLQLACALDIPPTIHCLKCWGHMHSILSRFQKNLPGFLLHSYTGPLEMIDDFVEMGAYFSFSGYFARADKVEKLEIWKRIPVERILIETDAPDMLPPPDLRSKIITDPEDPNHQWNHPSSIIPIYNWLTDFLGWDSNEFSRQISINYRHLFGYSPIP